MKKISVCGKGGSGKSTVVTLLANEMRQRGYQVLVVDSDESNPGLYRMLRLPRRPVPLLELVGGKKNVFRALSGESQQEHLLRREEIPVADIPSQHVVEMDGVRLVCIGKILQSLEGCACPMGALSREFLKRLRLKEDELAIIDMEAGIEHFGRGVETSIDSLLTVIEPSFDSLELAEKIKTLAAEAGMENVWTVLNKITSEEIGLKLKDQLGKKGIAVIGSIDYDPEIFQSCLEGHPLHGSKAEKDIRKIADQLL